MTSTPGGDLAWKNLDGRLSGTWRHWVTGVEAIQTFRDERVAVPENTALADLPVVGPRGVEQATSAVGAPPPDGEPAREAWSAGAASSRDKYGCMHQRS